MKKNETIWCETIDAEGLGVVKSGQYRKVITIWTFVMPFGVEGKEFRLTPGRQSVMNIFTAS
jgi:hypothetical protein